MKLGQLADPSQIINGAMIGCAHCANDRKRNQAFCLQLLDASLQLRHIHSVICVCRYLDHGFLAQSHGRGCFFNGEMAARGGDNS